MNASKLVRIVLVIATLAAAAPAAAQFHGGAPPNCQGAAGPNDPARAAQHWQMRAQRLASRLQLNAAQQQQLQQIVQAELQRWQSTVATQAPHTPQRHAAREALMQDFDNRLSAILTPPQQTQWAALKLEMRARFEQRREHRMERWEHGQGGQGRMRTEEERGI